MKMKKRYSVILFLVTILSFVTGYLWQITHSLGHLTYSIQHTVVENEVGQNKYKIDAEYPLLVSGIPLRVKDKINNEIEAWSKNNFREPQYDFEKMMNDPLFDRASLELVYNSKVSIKNDFKKLPYINIIFETYTYSGGAHGITTINTFVYDARTGERIGLDTVFTGDYLGMLSKLSLEELKKKDPDLETYNFAIDGTKPLIENFETWTLEEDGIHIIFGDYQVGPYVVGRPEIVIEYTNLKNILKEDVSIYSLVH